MDMPPFPTVICPPEKHIKPTHSKDVVQIISVNTRSDLASNCVIPVTNVSFHKDIEIGLLVDSFIISGVS